MSNKLPVVTRLFGAVHGDGPLPVLTPVTSQTLEATGAAGAVATFAATATDATDGTDPIVFREGTNVVHSGATFSIGTHTITASATESLGNTSPEQFTITVPDTTPHRAV
jgi:hypothetical protein